MTGTLSGSKVTNVSAAAAASKIDSTEQTGDDVHQRTCDQTPNSGRRNRKVQAASKTPQLKLKSPTPSATIVVIMMLATHALTETITNCVHVCVCRVWNQT